MSEIEFLLVAAGLLAVTFSGLAIGRILRQRRDEAYSDTNGGWTVRSQLPIDPGHPYNLFLDWMTAPFDVREGHDEGFDVSYFDFRSADRLVRSGAIVQLPVEGPAFAMTEGGSIPAGVGPRTAEILKYLAGLSVRTAPYALFVRSVTAPGETVQRTALALAKAMVADAGGAEAARSRPRPGRRLLTLALLIGGAWAATRVVMGVDGDVAGGQVAAALAARGGSIEAISALASVSIFTGLGAI